MTASRLLILLCLLVVTALGCNPVLGDDDSTGNDDSAGDDDSGSGAGTLQVCDPIPASDPFDLDAAIISGDNLDVTLSYGGGCEVHQFDLCWNELVMQSFPPQVNLSLIHEDNNDSCFAVITEQLTFDLTPLQASASQGEIVIQFEGQTLNYTY